MKKSNRSGPRRPQKSRREANQEFRKAVQAGQPKSFGIRRRLDYEDNNAVRDNFYDLLLDHDELSMRIEPRAQLHLTLMRRRQLDSQLARGIVAGYELGKAAEKIKWRINESRVDSMKVELGEPRIMNHGRAVVLAVEGDEMREEAREVMKAMASIGLKGALRQDGFRPHVTLGEAANPLSRIEKNEVLSVVNEVFPEGQEVTLLPLEFYPRAGGYPIDLQ